MRKPTLPTPTRTWTGGCCLNSFSRIFRGSPPAPVPRSVWVGAKTYPHCICPPREWQKRHDSWRERMPQLEAR